MTVMMVMVMVMVKTMRKMIRRRMMSVWHWQMRRQICCMSPTLLPSLLYSPYFTIRKYSCKIHLRNTVAKYIWEIQLQNTLHYFTKQKMSPHSRSCPCYALHISHFTLYISCLVVCEKCIEGVCSGVLQLHVNVAPLFRPCPHHSSFTSIIFWRICKRTYICTVYIYIYIYMYIVHVYTCMHTCLGIYMYVIHYTYRPLPSSPMVNG